MASTSRRSELAKNFLLSFASVSGTLLLLEIGVRVFAPMPLVASDLFLVTERLPEVQVRTARRALKPDVQCRQTSAEYDVAVHINHQGLRDVEHAYGKPSHTTRVLFLGDSFVFGYGVEAAERFTNRVQTLLNASTGAARRYEIINAGVPSWGTTDELLWLQEEGLKYHPDLVVLCFYENDVRDNYDRDLFAIDDGKLVRKTHGPAVPTGRPLTPGFVTRDPFNDQVLNLTDASSPTLRQPHAGFLVTHSHLARLVRQVLLSRTPAAADGQHEDPIADRAASQALTARLLDEVRHVSEAAGAGFKVVLIPYRGNVQRHRSSSVQRFPVLQRWVQAQPAGRVRDLVAGLSRAPEPQGLYFHKDRHLTVRGHTVAAEIIARFLVGLYPSGSIAK